MRAIPPHTQTEKSFAQYYLLCRRAAAQITQEHDRRGKEFMITYPY